MRKNIHYFAAALGSFLLISMITAAQSNRMIYAITDIQQQGANWNFLRKLSLPSNSISNVLLNGTNANQEAYDAATGKRIEHFNTAAKYEYPLQPAFSSGVAALAYDKKNERLYYTPMYIDQLRYIDLKTMKVYYASGRLLSGTGDQPTEQGTVISRMTIAGDGSVYALTNDAMHLIRISKGRNIMTEDLGIIVDAPENKSVSIHNSCTSYGGDMIADNEGNLYLITGRNHVFKFDPETKVATHIASIKGLPATFTANGAAVDHNNKIIISSAADTTAPYYIVDPGTWTAKAFSISGEVWRSSDLASSNLLRTKKASVSTIEAIEDAVNNNNNNLQVFPNPVTENQFTLQFTRVPAGNYAVQVTDVMGRQVALRMVNVNAEEQTENIKLHPNTAKGIYLIKATEEGGKYSFTKKFVVQ